MTNLFPVNTAQFAYSAQKQTVRCAFWHFGEVFKSKPYRWKRYGLLLNTSPEEFLLAQFSLYVHKGSLKPHSFHFYFACSGTRLDSDSPYNTQVRQRCYWLIWISLSFEWTLRCLTLIAAFHWYLRAVSREGHGGDNTLLTNIIINYNWIWGVRRDKINTAHDLVRKFMWRLY